MSDLTGELIDGRYQLIRQIANGGMAVIYEALDTRLDRKVAVKIMHPHLAQDEAIGASQALDSCSGKRTKYLRLQRMSVYEDEYLGEIIQCLVL